MKVVIENSLGPHLVAKIYHDVKLVIIAPMIYVLTNSAHFFLYLICYNSVRMKDELTFKIFVVL